MGDENSLLHKHCFLSLIMPLSQSQLVPNFCFCFIIPQSFVFFQVLNESLNHLFSYRFKMKASEFGNVATQERDQIIAHDKPQAN